METAKIIKRIAVTAVGLAIPLGISWLAEAQQQRIPSLIAPIISG